MKITWNYRVIEFSPVGFPAFRAIHEVHYENERPVGYSKEPAVISWEVGDENDGCGPDLMLERMREALAKSVLYEKDFVKEKA